MKKKLLKIYVFVIKMITKTIGTWKDLLDHPSSSSVWLQAASTEDIKSTDTHRHIDTHTHRRAVESENRASRNRDND